MRTIFIADAHLAHPEDLNYRLLLAFLEQIRGTVSELCILGDLFDFWVGLPGMPLPDYQPVIEALEKLAAEGVRLTYFEGNHDFQLGPVFRKRLKADVFEGPAIRDIQGKRLLICHGDQLNPHDQGYIRLRKILRSLPVRLLIRICPAPLAMFIKEHLQKRSRRGYRSHQARWDRRSIIRDFARQQANSGIDGMVCGHFHLPFHEQLDDQGFTILSLGDWISQFSYGEMSGGRLKLHTFNPDRLNS